MKIIVGLGNPGKKYELTRHNLGFMVVDELAKKMNLIWSLDKKLKAETAKFDDLLLVKPQTYMNLSGETVKSIFNFYKAPAISWGETPLQHELTVVHDDLDIDFGKYKVAENSRAAGHNGVQSIIDQLGTKEFKRYRVGIRNNKCEKVPADKFVLQKFNPDELEELKPLIKQLAEILKTE